MTLRQRRYLLAFGAAAGAAVLLCPFIGVTHLSPRSIWSPAEGGTQYDIFWKIRMPRVSLAFMAGAVLAVSGMVFQAMFRNVLATPFTLGIASGAAFGASLAYRLGLSLSVVWLNGSAVFSLSGAILTMVLVWALASPARGFSSTSMLLAGVIISFFFSSLIMLMQYISDFAQVFQMTRWLMGSLDVVGFEMLLGVLPLFAAGLGIVGFMTRELDMLTLGDELAQSRGLNASASRKVLFFATSLMVGGVVAVCGPIGFVGLIIPYVCRTLLGASHERIFWGAFLLGGAFLVICDTIARMIIAPSEIPVGVVTAVLGGPFFLWVLLKSSSRSGLMS